MIFHYLNMLIVIQLVIANALLAQPLLNNLPLVKRDDGSSIQYYLRLEEAGKHSDNLLVTLQGSDCNSVSKIKGIDTLRKVYRDADVLTVEKYGITDALPYSAETERADCPDAYIENDCIEQRACDIDRIIRLLRGEWPYRRVILVGGSEGATVAAMLSAKVDYISATVLFGVGGRYFLDDVIHSMAFTISSEEELARSVEGIRQLAQAIHSDAPFDIEMSNHGYKWWHSMFSFDQEATLARINSPVLILQGGNDRSASPAKATEMVNALKKKGKNNFDYIFYPEYDHALHLSDGDDPSGTVIGDINNWLHQKVL